MEETYIKLISQHENQKIEFTLDPDMNLEDMVINMECFLKSMGYQFEHLNFTSKDF